MNTLGKPIGAVVGQTAPLEEEHGAGTGVGGGHAPSASNQARGYGQQDSSFNAGLGGEHASGGLPHNTSTPIADKFMGQSQHSSSHTGQQGHSTSGDAVSGSYEGGSTRNALTGESNAHTTGAGVGILGENLHGHSAGQHSQGTQASHGASAGAYDGSINRSSTTGDDHSHSARDAALTGTAGAAAATALGSAAHDQSHSHGTDVGVGAVGSSGGHYSTGQQGHSGVTGAVAGLGASTGTHGSSHGHNHGASQISGQGQDYSNVGTGAGASVLAGQQASARGTHGDSGISAGGVGAGSGAAGSAHTSGMQSSSNIDKDNARGEPLSNPKDLDSGSRHGLIYDEATKTYTHRHDLEGRK